LLKAITESYPRPLLAELHPYPSLKEVSDFVHAFRNLDRARSVSEF
jgi:hypothetical protein